MKATTEPRAQGQEWHFGLIRVSSEGSVVDTVPLPLEGGAQSFVLLTPEGPLLPFIPMVRYAWSPLGYLVAGSNEDYSLNLLRISEPVVRIEREFTPVRLGGGERDQWAAWARFFERRPEPRGGGPRRSYEIPKIKPAYRELRIDGEGRIWVHRYVKAVARDVQPRAAGDERPPPLTWREEPTYDVF